MTHWYGQKVGTDTYHHDARHPSCLRLHERLRAANTTIAQRQETSHAD